MKLRLLRKHSFSSMAVANYKVGFIGLGNMGASMASNLLKVYSQLHVYDINKESVSKLVTLGAKAASSPCDIANE